MKKRKGIIVCLGLFTMATIIVLSNSLLMQSNNRKIASKPQTNGVQIIDTESLAFQESIEAAFKEEYGDNYKEILDKNIKSSSLATKIDLKFMNQKTGEINYPSDFGGQYINDDNELVVQIVKNINSKKSIKSITSAISDKIKYEYVSNSHEELEKINDIIINYFIKKTAINKGLVANYVDVINNIVVVELENNTKEEQDWFKSSVINSPLIKFVKGEHTSLTGAHNAGGSANDYCSIGYRVKYNGVAGFVSAAHCYDDGDELPGLGVVQFGVSEWENGIDAVFIQNSSGNYVTNNIEWGTYPTTKISTNTNLYNALVVGGSVAKSGRATHATSGKIKSLNYSATDKYGNYHAKFVETTAMCDNGDSGGLVYQPSGSSAIGGTVLGIMHSKKCLSKECKEQGPAIFGRSDWADNALGVSRY